jgi:hypothetical protein
MVQILEAVSHTFDYKEPCLHVGTGFQKKNPKKLVFVSGE